jgi:cyclopropane-fatty-acyl-phospholipid synthase
MWMLDKMLTKLVRDGQLMVTDHDGRSYRYGDPAAEPVRIRLTDPKAAWHIARDPRVGAGEAYMDGRLMVEPPHDIRDMILLVMGNANRPGSNLAPQSRLKRILNPLASRLDQINLRSRSASNVVHHYGLTRQFYELFLDEDRMYSMAYYRDPANSLERAQLDKKALIAAKLHLEPGQGAGMRVLDIGCGWGGFGLYLNCHYGCEVLGVSLAPDQVAFANERAEAAGVADKVRFKLLDYRDVEGRFDRISSIGMIEHLGKAHYDEYFGKTRALLADDGVMLTHTIGRTKPTGGTDEWNRKYIFPGHFLPSASELSAAAERNGWEVADLEVLRYHYAYTLAEWYRRACLHQAEITALYDARFFRMWQFYLVGAEQGFRLGSMVNYQLQTITRRAAVPATRDYIETEALVRTGRGTAVASGADGNQIGLSRVSLVHRPPAERDQPLQHRQVHVGQFGDIEARLAGLVLAQPREQLVGFGLVVAIVAHQVDRHGRLARAEPGAAHGALAAGVVLVMVSAVADDAGSPQLRFHASDAAMDCVDLRRLLAAAFVWNRRDEICHQHIGCLGLELSLGHVLALPCALP